MNQDSAHAEDRLGHDLIEAGGDPTEYELDLNVAAGGDHLAPGDLAKAWQL